MNENLNLAITKDEIMLLDNREQQKLFWRMLKRLSPINVRTSISIQDILDNHGVDKDHLIHIDQTIMILVILKKRPDLLMRFAREMAFRAASIFRMFHPLHDLFNRILSLLDNPETDQAELLSCYQEATTYILNLWTSGFYQFALGDPNHIYRTSEQTDWYFHALSVVANACHPDPYLAACLCWNDVIHLTNFDEEVRLQFYALFEILTNNEPETKKLWTRFYAHVFFQHDGPKEASTDPTSPDQHSPKSP